MQHFWVNRAYFLVLTLALWFRSSAAALGLIMDHDVKFETVTE